MPPASKIGLDPKQCPSTILLNEFMRRRSTTANSRTQTWRGACSIKNFATFYPYQDAYLVFLFLACVFDPYFLSSTWMLAQRQE